MSSSESDALLADAAPEPDRGLLHVTSTLGRAVLHTAPLVLVAAAAGVMAAPPLWEAGMLRPGALAGAGLLLLGALHLAVLPGPLVTEGGRRCFTATPVETGRLLPRTWKAAVAATVAVTDPLFHAGLLFSLAGVLSASTGAPAAWPLEAGVPALLLAQLPTGLSGDVAVAAARALFWTAAFIGLAFTLAGYLGAASVAGARGPNRRLPATLCAVHAATAVPFAAMILAAALPSTTPGSLLAAAVGGSAGAAAAVLVTAAVFVFPTHVALMLQLLRLDDAVPSTDPAAPRLSGRYVAWVLLLARGAAVLLCALQLRWAAPAVFVVDAAALLVVSVGPPSTVTAFNAAVRAGRLSALVTSATACIVALDRGLWPALTGGSDAVLRPTALTAAALAAWALLQVAALGGMAWAHRRSAGTLSLFERGDDLDLSVGHVDITL